ncbi:MAG: DinB family protein [Gemmatimonadales bacterium]
MTTIIASIEAEYRRYKTLGEGAIRQLTERELAAEISGENNSVATIAWHIAGNLKSRFTDFLTSDGEKPWRNRETEFEARQVTQAELAEKWDDGWSTLFKTLDELSEPDISRTVTIRGRELTVLEALHRSLAHVSYHVGQIVYIAKSMRGDDWEYLSIPPGKSTEYNRNPTLERGPSVPKGT